MSLLTVERASPSEGSASESDLLDADDPQAEERSKCSSVEGFLATKSIAVGLGHRMQWRLNSSQYQGEGYAHLRALVQLICPPDECKLAVELESRLSFRRYFVMVARIGVQDTEESAILGVDWVEGSRLRVGLVFPIWRDVHVVLDGDGGFSVSSGSRTHTFKPVSVQCMWAAFQALHKACENARRYNYYPAAGSLSHTWIGYYLSEMTNEVVSLNEWNIMNDLQSDRPETPPLDPRQLVKPSEKEIIKQAIYVKLKDVMMRVDLESITSKEVRERLQIVMEMDLRSYKSFIDEQIIRIFGQMENPSQILEHLYLGSEWNASNLEELKELGIGHILNISREIDNFFPPEFKYKNIRVFDDEHADLLRHWDDTFRFIHTAKLEGSKVLVHCKMGISRSASTVIAYLMKEKKWDLDVALSFVKECRSIINPNANFRKQLKEYEGIISARYNPHWGQMAPQQFRKRHHSEAYLLDLYQQHFGESAMEKVASDDQPMDDGEEHDHMTLQVQHTLTKEEVRKSWCSGMDVDSYELEGQYLQQTKASRLTEYLSSLEKAEVPSYEGLQEFSFSSISMEEAQVFRRAGSLSPSALTGACGRGTPSAKRMRRVTSSPIEPFFSHAATTQPSTLDYAQSKIEISTESELDEHTNIECNRITKIFQPSASVFVSPRASLSVGSPCPNQVEKLPLEPMSPMAQTITSRQCDSVKVMISNLESLSGSENSQNKQLSLKLQSTGGFRIDTVSPSNSTEDEEMNGQLHTRSNTARTVTSPLIDDYTSKSPQVLSPKQSPELADEHSKNNEKVHCVVRSATCLCSEKSDEDEHETATTENHQDDVVEGVGVKQIVLNIEAQFGSNGSNIHSPSSDVQIQSPTFDSEQQSIIEDTETEVEVQRIMERLASPTPLFYTPATSPTQLENRTIGLTSSATSTPLCWTPAVSSPKLSPCSSFSKLPAEQDNQEDSELTETKVAMLVQKFQEVTKSKSHTLPRFSEAASQRKLVTSAKRDAGCENSSLTLPSLTTKSRSGSSSLHRSQSFSSPNSPTRERRIEQRESENSSLMSPRTRRRSIAIGWNNDDADLDKHRGVSVQLLLEKFRKLGSASTSSKVGVRSQQSGEEVATSI